MLANVHRLLSPHFHIVTSSSVQGKVTVRIIAVPLEEGLRIILATNGFTCEKFGDILSVAFIP